MVSTTPRISAGEYQEAITEGVRQAFYDVLTHPGSVTDPTDALLDTIRKGVCDAFDQLFPRDIENAIISGVREAMNHEP